MKIAYATTYDARDAASWPKFKRGNYGSNSYIAATLENEGIELDYLGPLKQEYRWLTRSKWLYYRHIAKKDYYSWSELAVCKGYGRQLAQKLNASNADLVLATEGANPIAYLDCHQPLVLWADTVVAELIDFYPYLKNICQETRRSIFTYEKRAIARCDLLIMTSDWAKENVIKHYGIDDSKVVVLPRGANIELVPGRSPETIDKLIRSRPERPCRLLFSGLSWERKGGDIAVKIAKRLNQRGVPTELIVLGCQPKLKSIPSFVKPIGYIDKSTEQGVAEMMEWVGSAHFMVLPTREDCTPNVLIEANAFGVPCLTTAIAGIPTIIREDINGKAFAMTDSIETYCDYVIRYMGDREAYHRLAMGAFSEYQTRLNWRAIGQTAKALFSKLVEERQNAAI